MINQKKTANAIGGKTARACESCLKRRAKWFCAADDAFLCQACDSSVHSANGLASRHHRVCLDTSKPPQQPTPSWHQGFAKKARTPRKNTNKYSCKYKYTTHQMMPIVPQVGNDDEYEDDKFLSLVEEEKKNNHQESVISDDQMFFSVPNLDNDNGDVSLTNFNDDGELFNFCLSGFEGNDYDHDVHDWEFPETELEEFAADVESLLEQEEEEEGGIVKGMKHEQERDIISANNSDHHCYFNWSLDVESEMVNFDLNINYGDYCGGNDEHNKSHHHQIISGAKEEENSGKVVVPTIRDEVEGSNNNYNFDDSTEANNNNKRRRIELRLNYEEVMNAWASQGCSSPWTTGRRPEFDLDHHGWPSCMGDMWPIGVEHRGNVKGGDGWREARVSRYREKRRTRLFSKKIRYEVRKLNAEKRPRLKGRFVKRTSLSQLHN